MALSVKQQAFIRDPNRFKFAHGSIRSSKTTAQIIDWLRWVPDAPPGPLAIIGKTRDTVGRNILEVIQQLDPRAIQWTAGASTAVIMGRRHHIIGANDARSEGKVRGLTLAGALVDEVTLLPEDFFTTLLGRLSVDGARIIGTTNPDSEHHWFNEKYLARAHELGWSVWHFTMHDNPGLSAEYIAGIATAYTGMYYQRFVLGQWVAAEGSIYDMWDRARHVVEWDDLPPMAMYAGIGVDQGTTNASSGILLGVGVDGCLYFVDEWREDPSTTSHRLTDQELSASFRRWLATEHHPTQRGLPVPHIAVDPAAASFRLQLYRDGVKGVTDADNDVTYGIRTVASLLGTKVPTLRVSTRCTGWLKEVSGYRWDPKKSKEGQDEPIKVNDHSMDAGRYAVTTLESVWRRYVTGPARGVR